MIWDLLKTNFTLYPPRQACAWLFSDCPPVTRLLKITLSPRSPLRTTRRLSRSGLSLLEARPSARHQRASPHRWESDTAFQCVQTKEERGKKKKRTRERDNLQLAEFNLRTKREIKAPRRGKQLKCALTSWSVPVNFKQFSRSPGATPQTNEIQERPGRTRPFEYVWSRPGMSVGRGGAS